MVALGVLGACQDPYGRGLISAQVTAPGCEINDELIEFAPRFYGAAIVDDKHLEIRVQRDSDFQDFSDGMSLFLENAKEMSETARDQPLVFGVPAANELRANFYLNARCMVVHRTLGVNFAANGGTITFSAFGPPGGDEQIVATLNNVSFVDPTAPTERFATVNGRFDFFYTRGRPAQRFP